jgi:hypothetical protein
MTKRFLKQDVSPIALVVGAAAVFLPLLFYAFCKKLFFSQAWTLLTFYKPHFNSVYSGRVGAWPVNVFYYLGIIVSWLTLYVFRQKLFAANKPSGRKIFFLAVLVAYFWLGLFQTIGLTRDWWKNISFVYNKTWEQRNEMIYGDIYPFAKVCREVAPGRHTAEFITDLDTSRDPGMVMHRALAYFLYPIDMRGVRPGPTDCLVIFAKKNAASCVPPDFRILVKFGDEHIFAVRKESLTK